MSLSNSRFTLTLGRSTCALLLSLCLTLGLAQENQSLLFILDGSGSMWGQVEGENKIEVAKEVMTALVNDLPAEMAIGLQAYGHREAESCTDIELLAPLGTEKSAINEAIQGIIPTGATPIAGALEQAAETLSDTEGRKSVVLISDGVETCDRDPCALLAELQTQGIDTTVHVVGFDVGEGDQAQLRCIAEAGNGQYFSAANAQELSEALTQVQEAVTEEPAVTTVTVQTVKQGTLTVKDFGDTVYVDDMETGDYLEGLRGSGDSSQFPSGSYSLRFGNQNLPDVEITEGEEVILDAADHVGTLIVVGSADTVYVDEQTTGDYIRATDEEGEQFLAGIYSLRVSKNTLEDIEVKAGETTTIDLSEYVGRLVVQNSIDTVYVDDAETGDYISAADEEGEQVFVGTYNLRISDGVIEGVEVKPGETTTLDVLAYVGFLSIEGAQDTIYVDDATEDYVKAYRLDDEKIQLVAGQYTLRLENQTVDIEIKAGEELQVVLE